MKRDRFVFFKKYGRGRGFSRSVLEKTITPAVKDAMPLKKNGYKIPLFKKRGYL
jgi:hypothetical protein